MKRILSSFTLLCIVFVTPVISAEIYKWVDENGKTHYGERPPGPDARQMDIKKAPQLDQSVIKRQEEQKKLLDVMEEERKQKLEEKKKADAEKKHRERQCTYARNELKDMKQANVRFYDLDKEGNRQYLSEEELKSQINELEKRINKYCK